MRKRHAQYETLTQPSFAVWVGTDSETLNLVAGLSYANDEVECVGTAYIKVGSFFAGIRLSWVREDDEALCLVCKEPLADHEVMELDDAAHQRRLHSPWN